MQKLRVVVDTNILISALGWKGNERTLVEKALKKEFIVLLSPAIFEEFSEVAKRPKFGLTDDEIDLFIDALVSGCEVVTPSEKLSIVRNDPDDDRILECAVEGKADYIITGDRHLLNLKEFKDIKIVQARKFFNILEGKKNK